MTERSRTGLVALVGLVIGALAAVATTSHGEGSTTEVNLVAHSAEAVGAAGSARADYEISMSMGSGGPSMGFSGDAAFDFATQAFSMTMDLDAPGAAAFDTEMRLVGGVMYMRMPAELGAPTPWVSFDIAVAGEEALAELGTGADIGQTLDYLRGAGNVVEIGRDEIRGVPTTHYRADLDLRKAAGDLPASQRDEFDAAVEQFEIMAGTTSMPADVWIDDDGLPRRMSYRIEIDGGSLGQPAPGDGRLVMSFTMDVYDYGQPVSVVAPPANQVTDMTADLDRLSALSTS